MEYRIKTIGSNFREVFLSWYNFGKSQEQKYMFVINSDGKFYPKYLGYGKDIYNLIDKISLSEDLLHCVYDLSKNFDKQYHGIEEINYSDFEKNYKRLCKKYKVENSNNENFKKYLKNNKNIFLYLDNLQFYFRRVLKDKLSSLKIIFYEHKEGNENEELIFVVFKTGFSQEINFETLQYIYETYWKYLNRNEIDHIVITDEVQN